MLKQSHIHWQVSSQTLGFLVAGVILSVRHHLFYLSLNGNVVSAHDFKLFGSCHMNLHYGSAENKVKMSKKSIILIICATVACVLPYVLAPVLITVEIFRCMYFLDPATWANNIPHVS